MGVFVKIFAIMAVLCAVSALPIDEVTERQVDLPATEIPSMVDGNDDLSRDKRTIFGHHGELI
jgi:hypothetical protein